MSPFGYKRKSGTWWRDVCLRMESGHWRMTERRTELLAALLTIWRWGRLTKGMKTGRTLGSFEQWCGWVRDPLLALGCKDPADRVTTNVGTTIVR